MVKEKTHSLPNPKKILHDLQVSELRYRRLFETAQDGILLLNADTGMIEDVNPYLIKMLGYPKGDFVKKYLWEIGVFEDIAASREKFKELQTKKYVRYENLPLETKDGRKIYVEFVSNEYPLDGTKVIQCNIRDITSRAKAEKDLREIAPRQKAILGAIPDIVMEIDTNKVYTWANEPGFKFFGKDVIGKSADSYFVGTQEVFKTVQPLFKGTKDVIYVESWQRRFDGEERLLAWWCKTLKDHKGNVTGALSTARDITEQRNLEIKIQENEKRYSITMQKTGQLIYEYHVDSGKITWMGAIKEVTGYTEKEFNKVDINIWSEMIHPDDRKKSDELLAQAQKEVSEYNVGYRFRRKNGDYIFIEDHGVFIPDEKGIAVRMYGTMIDISARKKMELELQESEKKHRALIENLHDMILIFDKNGKSIWNSPSVRQYGHSESITYGHDLSELIQPSDLNKVKEAFSYVIQHPEKVIKVDAVHAYTMDKRQIYIDASLQYLPDIKEINGVVVNAHDVTDRETAKQKIMEENAKNQAILTSIGDAVLACDTNGNILLFNKVAEELTGLSLKEALGKNYHQVLTFVRESDLKPGKDFIAEALTTNKITEMANHTLLVRKDGQKIPVADSAAPVKDNEGKTFGCVVVFRDVTKEREIDKAKTEFVSLASHELRTPLATINWYSEMLLANDAGNLNKEQQEYTNEIHISSKRMVELINALLNVSRLELGTFSIIPEKLDIIMVTKNCIKELASQILEKKLIINEEYEKDLPPINADSNLLNIIFRNILSNSVKYTLPSGKINISISKYHDSFLIKVSDTGIGIPKEQASHIFSKMFRADNAKKMDSDGTGLGLYTVKEVVDHSGGKTWFESNKKKGTNFYVTFPLSGMVKKEGTKQLV